MIFEGPTGNLEGEFCAIADAQVAAVLCHPHPQMGGSMHDMVLTAMHDELAGQGVSTLRFNYRGVGLSEGVYDNGKGEVDDTICAVQWLRDNGDVSRVILAGYSFGGVMALKAAEKAAPDVLLLVAPAVSMAGDIGRPELTGLVILAEQDQFVGLQETRDWFADNTVVKTLEGDHFFMGQHDMIGAMIRSQLTVLTGSAE